jgi:hypothetical protein
MIGKSAKAVALPSTVTAVIKRPGPSQVRDRIGSFVIFGMCM